MIQPAPNVHSAFRLSFTESHLHLSLSRRQWVRNHFSKEVIELGRPAGIPGRSHGEGNRAWPAERSAYQSLEVGEDRAAEVCTAELNTCGHTREKAMLGCPFENHDLTKKFQLFHIRKFYPDLKVNVYSYTLTGIK